MDLARPVAFGLALTAAAGCTTRTVYVIDDRPAVAARAVDPESYIEEAVPDAEANPAPTYERDAGISDPSDFVQPLSPYGSWIQYPGHGLVFVPSVQVVGRGFRPYTHGHWEHTEWGWTWVDHHPFGWATGHYGRWFYDGSYGWVWVPGTQWGPAWVTWRTGGGYVGWAAMPPGAYFGGSYAVYDTSWAFVSTRNFGVTYVGGVLVTGTAYRTCYYSTAPSRSTVYVYGRPTYRGPDYDVVSRETRVIHRPIEETERDRPTTRPPTVAARGRDDGRSARDDDGQSGRTGGVSGRDRDAGGGVSGRDRDRDGGTRDDRTGRDDRDRDGGIAAAPRDPAAPPTSPVVDRDRSGRGRGRDDDRSGRNNGGYTGRTPLEPVTGEDRSGRDRSTGSTPLEPVSGNDDRSVQTPLEPVTGGDRGGSDGDRDLRGRGLRGVEETPPKKTYVDDPSRFPSAGPGARSSRDLAPSAPSRSAPITRSSSRPSVGREGPSAARPSSPTRSSLAPPPSRIESRPTGPARVTPPPPSSSSQPSSRSSSSSSSSKSKSSSKGSSKGSPRGR